VQKGISPIVAVVLLIAISVIAAIGVYFWVGGLATRQPTPSTPKTITTYAVSCNTANTSGTKNATILISNTSPPGAASVGAGMLNTSLSSYYFGGYNCPSAALSPGGQGSCIIINYGSGDGTVSVFGDGIASSTVTC